jgi:Ser/Thr protein kinase RdoA (MazF antagonist)
MDNTPPAGDPERAREMFAAWSIDPQPPVLVRRSANEVYRARRGGMTVYLRAIPAGHRRTGEVQAELEWMQALVAAGLPVVRPVASSSGRLVESGRGDWGAAALACFESAPGRVARKPDDYRPPVIDGWAGLLADLHGYARAHPAVGRGRASWDQDQILVMALLASDPDTARAQAALRALVAWMRGLPTGPDEFGLTHADLHLANLSVDGDRVTAFDFDDACHHWFLHDLAVAVTSIRKAAWEYPDHFDAAAAEAQLVERYFARSLLSSVWRSRLEGFVAYRIALSACWASRAGETGQLDQEMQFWYRRSLPWWLGQLERADAAILGAISA